MLATNLTVCQYAAMFGQNNNTSNVSNHSNGNIVPTSGNNSSNTNNGSQAIHSINSASHVSASGNTSTSGNNHISGLSASTAKNQLEQLHTMREALFSQDGWGCQHVNQDTNWEIPSSPETIQKDNSVPASWKPTVNNGTDLWETNLRNGGQSTTQSTQKASWGHTPSTNLGGTWGEDDDSRDTNVWSGTHSSNLTSSSTNIGVSTITPSHTLQWGQGSVVSANVVGVGNQSSVTTPAGASTATPTGNMNISVVNASGTTTIGSGTLVGNGWSDPRELRPGSIGTSLDIRSVDHIRSAHVDARDLRMMDPRDPIRGDPRGISGRLNGNSEMWSQHHPIIHNPIPNLNKIVGATTPSVSATTVTGNVGASNVGNQGVVAASNVSSAASTNVAAPHWGASQSLVAPKDLGSLTSKTSSTGWEEPSPPPQRRNMSIYDDGTALWGQQSRMHGTSHWKDVPDARNHLMRNSLGGQNSNANLVPTLGSVSNTNISNNSGNLTVAAGLGTSNTHMSANLASQSARIISGVGGSIGSGTHKVDNPIWSHSCIPNVVRNPSSAWVDDSNHNVIGSAVNTSGWIDDKSPIASVNIGSVSNSNINVTNGWNDLSNTSWNKQNSNKLANNSNWSITSNANNVVNDLNDINSSDWSNTSHSIMGKTQQQKVVTVTNMNTEIRQCKQFRILVDAGFKKEDVERALINSNMNIEEATDILRNNAIALGIDTWRRHDDSMSYSDNCNTGGTNFSSRYSNPVSQTSMPFTAQNAVINTVGGSVVGNNSNLNNINSMQSLQVQKYLNQASHTISNSSHTVNPTTVAFGQNINLTGINPVISNSTNQPSTQQLRMLVQQIQLAVHNGYLSSQILNQPLAPTTLLLLNQLLSNIKHLQGAQQLLSRGGSNANTLVVIAKYKQQIQNLQSQINTQQALYIKQQQQQQTHQPHQPHQPHQSHQPQVIQQSHTSNHISNTNAEYLRRSDPINVLQSNFSEINLNKPAGYHSGTNSQSRLNQWKLPVLDKDTVKDNSDFARAPGTTKQNLSAAVTINMNSLGEGAWSTNRGISEGWPDSNSEGENKDWSVCPASAATYTDLVQEFEPGKPWKGPQIKSIEDDPSITPGSVARSPLSLNSTPKDADIFANTNKSSPTDLPALGLSTSSTWSFNPSTNSQNFSGWCDNSQQELWASALNKPSRGPPPGLNTSKCGTITAITCLSNTTTAGTHNNSWLTSRNSSGWSSTNPNWNSSWLLLKNLTTQIDSSTLRTLCMQHGPLLRFHLYLSQGIALCKYATREEANKAQMTLNNCFLGNTTICAESPSESEVENMLHKLTSSHNSSSSSGNMGTNCNVIGGINNSINNSVAGNCVSSTGNIGNNTCANTNVNNSINNGISSSSGSVNNNSNNVSQNSGISNTGTTCNSGPSQSAAVHNINQSSCVNNNANTSNWRQQLQNISNQPRSSGRDDFEYISQYVCSIVDD